MKQSKYCNFNLPENTDFYDVEHYNANFRRLDQLLELIAKRIIDKDTINTAFHEVFPDSPEPEPPEPETDPNALTPTAITDALDTPWDGSSSTDTLALKSDAIADTLEAEWDGSSSTDTLALKAYQINEICK